jgi:hypothetical protein
MFKTAAFEVGLELALDVAWQCRSPRCEVRLECAIVVLDKLIKEGAFRGGDVHGGTNAAGGRMPGAAAVHRLTRQRPHWLPCQQATATCSRPCEVVLPFSLTGPFAICGAAPSRAANFSGTRLTAMGAKAAARSAISNRLWVPKTHAREEGVLMVTSAAVPTISAVS